MKILPLLVAKYNILKHPEKRYTKTGEILTLKCIQWRTGPPGYRKISFNYALGLSGSF